MWLLFTVVLCDSCGNAISREDSKREEPFNNADLVRVFNNCVNLLTAFRNKHIEIVAIYILAQGKNQAAKVSDRTVCLSLTFFLRHLLDLTATRTHIQAPVSTKPTHTRPTLRLPPHRCHLLRFHRRFTPSRATGRRW